LAKLLIAAGKGGSIVNLASNACQMVPTPQPQASYNASKAGMIMLTQSLAIEWIKYGIRVNAVSPGYVATDMIVHVRADWLEQWKKSIPAGRMGKPYEIASAVIYLFSDASAFSVGSNVIIDGGAHCV
jgi:NAD(P)-dependent dehydrogenase (short-subunit alcohol dehydrogenase family)